MSLLAKRFREEVSKCKDYRMKVETEFPVGYSTGFLGFDFKNGTIVHTKVNEQKIKYYSIGITDGSMTMIIGRSGCGKTTWAVQTAANIIRPFKTSCIFHDDIEGGMTENRKEGLARFVGVDLKDRYVSRNTGITAENFYERVKMIHDLKINDRESYEYDTGLYDTNGNRIFKLEPTVIILDSLALLMPEKYTDEDDLSGQMAATAAAKTNAAIFKRIVPLLKSANIIMFVINHINQKVELNKFQATKAQVGYLKQNETLPGGNAPVYLANAMIRFDDHSKLTSEDVFGIDGTIVAITFVKSRSNKSGQSINLVYNQEVGFDPDLSLFLMLKDMKIVNTAGAYAYIGDRKDIKFFQRQFKDKLQSNPELRAIFKETCLKTLTEMLERQDHYEEIHLNDNFNAITNDLIGDLNNFSNAV